MRMVTPILGHGSVKVSYFLYKWPPSPGGDTIFSVQNFGILPINNMTGGGEMFCNSRLIKVIRRSIILTTS